MRFSPEETASYNFSISNLATLKVFHDAGLDVSSYSNYMVDANYSMDSGKEIFDEGCQGLFTDYQFYSSFETEEGKYLDQLKEDEELPLVPEFFYEFSNRELKELFKDESYKKQISEYIKKENNKMGDSYYDGDLIPLSFGAIGLILYSLGQFHELAEMLVNIKNETNRLYQKLKGEQGDEINN